MEFNPVKFCKVVLPVARMLPAVRRDEMRPLVAVKLVEKRLVVVAPVPVALMKVKFCRVEEPLERRFPVVINPEKVAATIEVSVVSRSRSSLVKVRLSPAVRLVLAEMSTVVRNPASLVKSARVTVV